MNQEATNSLTGKDLAGLEANTAQLAKELHPKNIGSSMPAGSVRITFTSGGKRPAGISELKVSIFMVGPSIPMLRPPGST